MRRTTFLGAAAGAVFAWCWLRLERPHVDGSRAVWLIALAVLPALVPRLRWRLAALVPAAVLAAHSAFGVWAVHPLRLAGRFGSGFLEFYDVRMPFAAAGHAHMEGVILIALFASSAVVALAVAARRPVLAALLTVVGAGWPATLLSGPDDLRRGAAILAVALAIVAVLEARIAARRAVVAVVVGGVVVLAALGVSHSSAIASGQVLRWQNWDFYTKPQKPVGLHYVWSSNYSGLRFPKKITPVLRIKAPELRTYWRATALDEFDGGNWYETAPPAPHVSLNGRDELLADEEAPPAARDSTRWIRQDVTVLGLHDNHLIGASVPVAYAAPGHQAEYAAGGIAYLQDRPISPGDRYTVWSYVGRPNPAQLARLRPRYPAIVRANDLYVEPREIAPPFGQPGREAKVRRLFSESYRAGQYRGFYDTAKRVVGNPRSPYAAALELEGWFRSGEFRYDEHPPPIGNTPPLVAFVLQTRAGYCQHFAGAMALMLRYLGIPARVAAGFTSGTYDAKTHEWTVTDHDAHTWVEAWFPRYGWLPFDPTPGRGNLDAAYTASSLHFDLSDGLRAVASTLQQQGGSFDLRKLQTPKARDANRKLGDAAANGSGSGGGARVWSLLEVLLLAALAAAAVVVAVKFAIRKRRYLTRDPRKLAAAYVRELEDVIADQGAAVPSSVTLRELGAVVEREFAVSAETFVAAAATARYGPDGSARDALRELRRARRALGRDLRRVLSRSERALGLVSLRSLGLTG